MKEHLQSRLHSLRGNLSLMNSLYADLETTEKLKAQLDLEVEKRNEQIKSTLKLISELPKPIEA